MIYKSTCTDGNGCYVGETVRHFSTRVKEHLASDRASQIYVHHYKILNTVAPCVQLIVCTFWITPQLLFNSRYKRLIHIQREQPPWNQQLHHVNLKLPLLFSLVHAWSILLLLLIKFLIPDDPVDRRKLGFLNDFNINFTVV